MTDLADGYRLIDAGDQRRLERFGDWLVDRPARTALEPRRDPGRWAEADRYQASRGWGSATERAAAATVAIADVRMGVRPAAGGQLGLFPEHATQAGWIEAAIQRRRGAEPLQILNLFAATGLLTLVAARAGAAVAHVDAARGAVVWARQNAAASGLVDRPIRWLVDDAMAFVDREARRGRRYDGLILDPPSYGHGKAGRSWEIDRDFVALIEGCQAIAGDDAFWLLTTHSTEWDGARLAAALSDGAGVRRAEIELEPLVLTAESGARLELGVAARHDPVARERR